MQIQSLRITANQRFELWGNTVKSFSEYIIGEQAYLIRVDEEKNEQNQLSQQNNQQDNEELQEENTQKLVIRLREIHTGKDLYEWIILAFYTRSLPLILFHFFS